MPNKTPITLKVGPVNFTDKIHKDYFLSITDIVLYFGQGQTTAQKWKDHINEKLDAFRSNLSSTLLGVLQDTEWQDPRAYNWLLHDPTIPADQLSILYARRADPYFKWQSRRLVFCALNQCNSIACALMGFIGKKAALKGRDKDEIWFENTGYFVDRCEFYGYDTKDLKTMGYPAREILPHPLYRTPAAFQVAYYLDFKASILPLNRNPEEQP